MELYIQTCSLSLFTLFVPNANLVPSAPSFRLGRRNRVLLVYQIRSSKLGWVAECKVESNPYFLKRGN
jgi:hypothetical protein